MKNKKLFTVIATALAACLVVGMGAMTYSKYVTSGNTEQTATAAKWGFVVTVDADNLFGEKYVKDATTLSVIDNDATSGITIDASADGNEILAPGSKGSMSFSVSGSAEVLAKIEVSGEATSEISAGSGYNPVVWTLKKGSETITTDGTLADAIAKLQANVSSGSVIQPNTTLSGAGNYSLSWEWAFETGANEDEIATNNVKDTVIGMTAEKGSALVWADVKDYKVGQKTIGEVFADQDALDAVKTAITFTLNVSISQVQE